MALRRWLQSLRQPAPAARSSERDIDIRLRAVDQPDGSCPVSITGPDDRRAEGRFRSPFSVDEIDRALAWMDQGTGETADTKAFGQRLFRALFQGAVAGIYVASQDNAVPARIRLTVDDPTLARIPWELLVDPAQGGALALRGRFVRGIASEGGARPLTVEPPLRILLADSAPRDQEALESQLEAREVEAALKPVAAQGRIEVTTLQHLTLSGLVNALREAAMDNPARPFHVLHWIGHGMVDATSGGNVLMFEDETGNSDPIDGARLADVLHDSEIRLVLLNACHSAAPSPAQAPVPAAETTRGIAEVLLTSGIPAVVGMRVSVLDTTAHRFAQQFYEALADGRAIDAAVLNARTLVVGRTPGDAAEIGVPIVYLRSGTGELLSSVTPLTWWQRPVARFRRLAPVWRVAVFVISVLAAIAIERGAEAVIQAAQGPTRMTGDYKVVVTEFDARDASGQPVRSQVASDLSVSLAETLQEDLEGVELARVKVRPPRRRGGYRARRMRSAPSPRRTSPNRSTPTSSSTDGWTTAGRRCSHSSMSESASCPKPRSWSGRSNSARRSAGRHPSTRRQPRRSRCAKRSSHGRARSRSWSWASVTSARPQFAQAERHFDVALGSQGWPDGDGKEILYLFRGSTAGILHQLPQAADWFNRALELNPDFARAKLGLAEVRFQESKGTCERGNVEADGLREAREAYRDTLNATDQPASANVSAKAHLGIARVDLCISQAELEDGWAEASAEAEIVVAAYEAGDDTLRQLAAEAHAVRAISELPVSRRPGRRGEVPCRRRGVSRGDRPRLPTGPGRRVPRRPGVRPGAARSARRGTKGVRRGDPPRARGGAPGLPACT